MKNVVLTLKNISKNFDDFIAVHDVNLEVEEKTIVGIIGRNGSGKTVLLKMIAGLYKETAGIIDYHGYKVIKDYGILIDTGFLENETGFENLKILSLIKNEIDDNKIEETMKLVRLDPLNETRYKYYSTGMKQKLKLAQVLMEDSKILILDEPFNGLDKDSVLYFRDMLKKLKADGKTIILTSHYQEDIDDLCDEVYEMLDGKLSIYKK